MAHTSDEFLYCSIDEHDGTNSRASSCLGRAKDNVGRLIVLVALYPIYLNLFLTVRIDNFRLET